MNIQWYPGHMTKARRMMQEDIKLIDLVIELVDARIPLSSKNPDIDELAKNKARLILLNKADLASPEQTKAWEDWFKAKGFTCFRSMPEMAAALRLLPELFRKPVKKKLNGIGAEGL